ncbi:GNAT family N-acetyltransferase [Serpentinicella alkaliphila]|uniref:Ribosomal-protein-serine acetyltransferase n=1 Tax=Serpentinicella alkaliphila TaxID=1734049 RepID=A0A4R2T0S2_9FIRM|nr:GNAT family protein [Serpentinicella alkaliphila]QUH26539.1 GNAT family N-acetyltransferase [Serpentinicella alkaliphila]TCP96459.1 ribosomal-protein-serine acetyltransferase [Serpentinicella alkaliphila]
MIKYTVDSDIELKILDNTHAIEIEALVNSDRSYLRKWLPWVDKTKSVKDIEAFIDSTKNQFASNNGFQTSIWYKGNLAGVIGFQRIDWVNRSTNIGYWIGKDYNGKGIMTKSVSVFVDYALIHLNLNRVEIRCAEQNYRSRAIPERLGFMKEGFVRNAEWLNDHYVSHIIYGMLATEWRNIRN